MTSWFRRRRSSDEGFTLIELTVAMMVTLLVATSLVTVFLSSISGVALSKQRQAATGLATGVMEKFRALDYGTLSAGLYCSDLAGDTNVTVSGTCGSGGTVTFAPAGTTISETLQVQSTAAPASSVPPIYPHRVADATTTVDGVQYTVKSYVTKAPTVASSFNLTVLVSWSSNVTKGQTKTVTQRSLEFSPSRCLSSATHPYSGACQASFNGDAGLSNAAITITGVGDTTTDIPGLGGRSLELGLPGLTTSLGVEQITKLTGIAQTTGVTTVGSATATAGGSTGAASADSDPSSTTGGTAASTVSQGSTSTLTLSGTAGSLSASPTTGDAGQVDTRVTSTASSCKDAAGNTITTTRPCAWGNVQATGTTAAVNLQLANGAPNFSLASIGAAPTPARASTAAIATAGGTACPTTSGVGCVSAQSTRSLGSVSLGGLPTAHGGDSAPTGWTGSLLTLSGVQETAYAESGIGARTPSFTRSGGTLSYYNPSTSSVQTVNLTTLASNLNVNLGTINSRYFQGGHQVDIALTASFRAGAAAAQTPTSTATDPACKTAACTASATPTSTLTATLVYDIFVDSVQATKFAMTVDLGACIARTSYTAAFDA